MMPIIDKNKRQSFEQGRMENHSPGLSRSIGFRTVALDPELPEGRKLNITNITAE